MPTRAERRTQSRAGSDGATPDRRAPPKAPRRARPRGPNDPGRRDRIAAAALEVALTQGVGAVSHRNVAAAAGVPLGSTTYHFRGLDDLLSAAMEQAAAAYAELLVTWSGAIADGADVVDALCDLVEHSLGPGRERLVAEYELYFAGLRRPALRPVSSAWSGLLALVLAQHVDEMTARELAIVVDGVFVNALVTGGEPRRPDLYELLRKISG
ncbi:MAG TPA: TetR family transcriptional regulator [Conexibacter sp.]|nr:TetR family transcriptional regulator [Conexibacter sp.]